MKKKVLSTLLALSMVLGLAACGGGGGRILFRPAE